MLSSVELRLLNDSSLIVIVESHRLIVSGLFVGDIILLLVSSIIHHMRLLKVLIHLRLSILRMSTAQLAHVIVIQVSFFNSKLFRISLTVVFHLLKIYYY